MVALQHMRETIIVMCACVCVMGVRALAPIAPQLSEKRFPDNCGTPYMITKIMCMGVYY